MPPDDPNAEKRVTVDQLAAIWLRQDLLALIDGAQLRIEFSGSIKVSISKRLVISALRLLLPIGSITWLGLVMLQFI